jgi:nitrate reductase NapAB chaperone NapD
MGVSAVAITLCAEPELHHATLAALAAEPAVTVGPRQGPKLAAVLDTDSRPAERVLLSWIEALPGVLHVALVFCSVDGATEQAEHAERG